MDDGSETGTEESSEPGAERAGDTGEQEEAWARYRASGDRRDRNELVLAFEPLVRRVVRRLPSTVRAYWEDDDLASFGMLGLIGAIERWKPSRSAARFPGYATLRVRGSIFDELRRLDWLPRTVRRRVGEYRAATEVLSAELGRRPASGEVLSSMGVPDAAQPVVLAEVQTSQLLHLEQRIRAEEQGGIAFADLVAADEAGEPESRLLAGEELAGLRAAIATLPERQRTVVTLHFLAGLTQEQIGAMLGVTNSRVSQVETAAMAKLRQVLAGTERASELATPHRASALTAVR